MRKITILTIALFPLSLIAQVGIGTTTPATTLDITAVNPTGASTNVDGILIPRVDRQRAQVMVGTLTSTLIYVNNILTGTAAGTAANITSVGFYYYDGALWQKIQTGAASTDWSLTGNAGTTPGVNFIGTTDAKDLIIKTGVGGVERARILSNGHVLVNTTTNNATSGTNNIFEVSTAVASEDAISGYANGAGGTGVFGQSNNTTGVGLYANNTGGGSALTSTVTGAASTPANTAAVFAQLDQTNTAGSQDVAGVIGLHLSKTLANGGYAGPLLSGGNSALGGVVGTLGSRETSSFANSYFFGVIGDVLIDNSFFATIPRRTGGVLGNNGSTTWGVLAYTNSAGTQYGTYAGTSASATAGGSGKTSGTNQENNNIGMGINGGFMGGFVKGSQYGLISKGSEFGMYVNGNTITNKPIVQLTETNGKRIATYTSNSTTVDVNTRGKAKMANGTAFVPFDENFKATANLDEENLNINVTPMGTTNGVYISQITKDGFYIKENNNGTSNTSINWIAVSKRKGYEKGVEISNEILANTFDKNMDGVMYNDGNTTGNASPIYFDGTKVRFEQMKENRSMQGKLSPINKPEPVKTDKN
ncbi:MAG: hypothetical protein ABI426_09655 [Flavobacterium sp.]